MKKDYIIIILLVIIVALVVCVINLKSKTMSNAENEDIQAVERENTEVDDMFNNEVENKFNEIYNRVSSYSDDILEKKLTSAEKDKLQTMASEIKNATNDEEKMAASQRMKEQYAEYRKKYISSKEQKNIDTYTEELDKIEEKYKEYTKISMKNTQITAEEQSMKESLEQEILSGIENLEKMMNK